MTAALHRERVAPAIRQPDPVWTCDVCRTPLGADDGDVTFNYGEWHDYRAALAAWEQAHPNHGFMSLAELATRPGAIPWRTRHYTCPGHTDSDYSIDVSRIRTWADVAQWTAHLHHKAWFPLTDWDQLLSRAGVWAWQS